MSDYVNEDCPAQCDLEHDGPSTSDSVFTCLTTGVQYLPEGDYYDPEWYESRHRGTESTLIGDCWYSDPYEYYTICYSCSEWVSHDDALTSDEDDCSYCESCYGEHETHGTQPDGDRYSVCETGGWSCATLSRGVIHFDTDDEATYCPAHAPDHPHMVLVPVAA